jgi:probable methyltransferase
MPAMTGTSDNTAARFSIDRTIQASGDQFADDVRRGLGSNPKTLLPHYFYDDLGSTLFAAICELPEYYLTRAESEILKKHAGDIAARMGSPARMIELGSGSARKTRILIEALLERSPRLEFVPIDVDPGVLTNSSAELLTEFPPLTIRAICGDFRDPAEALSRLAPVEGRTTVLFLGSSIGNLPLEEAESMFTSLRSALRPGDSLFLGADRKKSASILEPAYDDALGVTAAFNRNLLLRMNRELGANFDLHSFAHRAFFNAAQSRIEMHLVSSCAQRVRLDALDLEVEFREGETIHTENSYKYDDETLAMLAARSGFTVEARWLDSREWFVDLLLVAA